MSTEEYGIRPPFRMEEEEEESPAFDRVMRRIGYRGQETYREEGEVEGNSRALSAFLDVLTSLVRERDVIITDEKLSAKDKRLLLDENRKAIVVAGGGKVTKTDSVVYGILFFGGTVLIVLALLTTYADLPAEVTLSFVGTVLGGTIATIAQKLGKI